MRKLVQVYIQGREFVGWVDLRLGNAEATMDEILAVSRMIKLHDVCTVSRIPAPGKPGMVNIIAHSVAKDRDYTDGTIWVSPAGAFMKELDEAGQTAELCNRERSHLHLPQKKVLLSGQN